MNEDGYLDHPPKCPWDSYSGPVGRHGSAIPEGQETFASYFGNNGANEGEEMRVAASQGREVGVRRIF